LESGLELEARVLLSARAAAMTNARHARATVPRETPYKEINDQYKAFASDFTAVENHYFASLTTSSPISTASINSFITNRTNQMAIDLVQYFNGLPLKLPFFNTPPHTPNNRGAIQTYVYNSIAGVGSTSLQQLTSLQQSLVNISLPTTTGSAQTLYEQTVNVAIAQSQTQTLNGVSEVYAGQLRVSAPIPNNRYGVLATGTIPAYITAAS